MFSGISIAIIISISKSARLSALVGECRLDLGSVGKAAACALIIAVCSIPSLSYAYAITGDALGSSDCRSSFCSPVFVDYAMIYGAGETASANGAETAYDADTVQDNMAQALQIDRADVPRDDMWSYSPSYALGIAMVFSHFGFECSAVVFLVVTFIFLLFSLAVFMRKTKIPWVCAAGALAAIGLFANIRFGQFAYLTTGLMVLAIAYSFDSPVKSGTALGVLAMIKPQLAFIPIIAIALSGKPKVFIYAVIAAVASAVVFAIIFGMQPWVTWFSYITGRSSGLLGEFWRETGMVQCTPYTMLRIIGLDGTPLYAALAVMMTVSVGASAIIARNTDDKGIAAIAIVGAFMAATPYYILYDMSIASVIGIVGMSKMLSGVMRKDRREALYGILFIMLVSSTFLCFFRLPMASPLVGIGSIAVCAAYVRGQNRRLKPATACRSGFCLSDAERASSFDSAE